MRASPRAGCAAGVPCDRALDAPVTHGRTAPSAFIEGRSVAGRQAATSGARATYTSCQYPVRGPLAVLDSGAVITRRPSDGGPRRDVTTITLTHSSHCAAYCAFRIHRYGVVVSAWHVIDASVWCCVGYGLVGVLREDVGVVYAGCAAMLCDTPSHCTMGRHAMTVVVMPVTRCLPSLPVALNCGSTRIS
jgi:hypothetical protein